MEHDPRTERRARWAAGFFVLAGFSWLWLTHGRPRDSHAFLPEPPPRAALDLAVSFLAEGQVSPPLEHVASEDLGAIANLLGWLVQCYTAADLEAFFELRRNDLAYPGRKLEMLESLASFCMELGMKEEEIPSDWEGRFRAFWARYYEEPPVRSFLPQYSRVALRKEVLDEVALEKDFERRIEAHSGRVLHHELVVPHRWPTKSLLGDGFRWLDFDLAFEPHDLGRGWLIGRFVWDGKSGEWFLQRATTVLEGERREDRRYLIL